MCPRYDINNMKKIDFYFILCFTIVCLCRIRV